ncbi:MAG TPA: amino acid permease [Candidatus Mcinerneyibacteriales bacterium]|nr:amino acid permease [Candidatus Mcinerneyibacteriales bacterium]HPJ69629.1 amino acid permease [Candidatus Mcinerneyibacteriales bacterium]
MKKELSLFNAFSIAAGAMISSGLFVLPGLAYSMTGPSVVVAYFLAGMLMIPTIFAKAELATAMPKAGGTYFYINRIIGTPAGFAAGIANWFSIASKSAFALVGIGTFALLFNPHLSEFHIRLIAAFFTVFFTLLNLVSTKHSGKLQSVLVVFLLAILGLFMIFGYPAMRSQHFHFFLRKGYAALFAATGMVFISFGGLTKIADMAEEIKDSARNLPKAMLYAFVSVNIIYVIVVAIVVGVLPHNSLITTLTPVSDAAGVFSGLPGRLLLALAAIFAFITTANAGIMSASRSPMAMSRDGLLPPLISKVSRRFKTPYISVLLTGLFILISILLLHIKDLVKIASAFMLLLFIFDNLSLIIIRYSRIRNYRPSFKAPLFPLLQLTAIAAYVYLIIEMGSKTLFLMGLFLFFIGVAYLLFARKCAHTQSALVLMAERIMDRNLGADSSTRELEKELLMILQDRDDITEDRFDKLIKRSLVLDIDKQMDREEFFGLLAEKLTQRLDLSREEIIDQFCKRERASSTNIIPGIAIPHIIIPGEGKFEIVLARSREGILWEKEAPPVHAVFILLGTADERTFHLRALMAVAQLLQESSFLDHWNKARDCEDLRSTILLMPRQRD